MDLPVNGSSLEFLPEGLRGVPYVYTRHPGAVAAGDVAAGANCQLYAYAVLAHFGRHVPPLHSSGLWAEHDVMETVDEPAPLDLLLFAARPKPETEPKGESEVEPEVEPEVEAGYAAHIGVHIGPDRVLHLCREVGVPVVWSYADFAARPRYARLLGVKRALRKTVDNSISP